VRRHNDLVDRVEDGKDNDRDGDRDCRFVDDFLEDREEDGKEEDRDVGRDCDRGIDDLDLVGGDGGSLSVVYVSSMSASNRRRATLLFKIKELIFCKRLTR